MPVVPLDHTEPLAATLGVMLYPGTNDADRQRARAWTAQFLTAPVREFLDAGGTLRGDELERLYTACGLPLDDIHRRWRDGLAVGQMVEVYFKASQTHPEMASWENARRAVEANAARHCVSLRRSSLQKARARYRSVAHLWGAWCLRGGIHTRPDVGYEAADDFSFLLMEAEILLRWGRTWRPKRAKATPPLEGEAWQVPAGWEPPEERPGWPQTRVSLEIPDALLVHFQTAGRPKQSAENPVQAEMDRFS